MRLAVISDASAPTPTPGSHGLGRACSEIAERLYYAGHDVTLFAAKGSTFSGELVTPIEPGQDYQEREKHLAKACSDTHSKNSFDVIYDHSHIHYLSKLSPLLPVTNHHHDKWQAYRRNAVLCSEGQRALMTPEFAAARVIHHQLEPAAYPVSYRADGYLLWMGVFRDYKQPVLAIEAAAKVGLPLKIAGVLPFNPAEVFSGNENMQYVGVVDGQAKLDLLRGATAFLQLGTSESFGLTSVEAALCGTPVVAWNAGGSQDIVCDGTNGAFIVDGNVAEAIGRARDLKRKAVSEYTAAKFGCPERQVKEVEQALNECAIGWSW